MNVSPLMHTVRLRDVPGTIVQVASEQYVSYIRAFNKFAKLKKLTPQTGRAQQHYFRLNKLIAPTVVTE